MLTLRQITHTGATKVWKLDPDEAPYTLGDSRFATLQSLVKTNSGFDLMLDYRNNAWQAIQLAERSIEAEGTPIRRIENDVEIDLGSYRIQLHHKKQSVKLFNSENQKGDKLIYVHKHRGRVLAVSTSKENLNAPDSEIEVHRTQSANISEIEKTQFKSLIDQDTKAAWITVVVMGIFAFASSQFMPTSHTATLAEIKQQTVMTVTTTPPPKKPEPVKPVEKAKAEAPAQAAAQKSEPAAKAQSPQPVQAKSFSLQNLSGGRLSKLMGKISAGPALSKNAVVANGIVAGSAASGRALSALSNVNQEGSDVATNAKVAGPNLAGLNAGKGSGLGALGGSSAGKGGINLIDNESKISGGLDKEVIAEVIRSHLGQVLFCYERQLSATPDLFGKVSVRFEISANGAVDSQSIAQSTLSNGAVEGCILSKVATWKFPLPKGGTKVVVTYPFMFKSTN